LGFRRQGWTFRPGGPGTGIYQSTDGGEHWTELNDRNSKACPRNPGGAWRWRRAASNLVVIWVMSAAATAYTLVYCDGTNVVEVGSSGGAVSSVFSRTGAVVAATNTPPNFRGRDNFGGENRVHLGLTMVNQMCYKVE
jgi:hypothetical protein